ncbi:MAG: T9SS type A sorting domain-containing protein [Ignavibacteria bacterium]|nr:T9SS type A sorting domain-containing protein [Ignavibacteria bacterium]
MKHLKLNVLLTVLFFSCSISFPQSWIQQTSGTTASLIDIYFLNTNTGFACGSGGVIVKTTNSGLNWAILNTGITSNLVKIKFFDANTGIAGGDKIIKTTNGGSNWSLIYDTAYAGDIHFLNQNEWLLCSSSPHVNKKTTNGGAVWQTFNSTDILQMCLFFINSTTGWITGKAPIGSFVAQHINKTINGGLNWSWQYTATLFNNGGWFYDLYFIDANTGFGALTATNNDKIIKTTNGGVNWFTVALTNFPTGIFFVNTTYGWASCNFGKIMKSTDVGTNWVTEQTPVSTDLNSIYFTTNETGWTCGDGGVILKTTNGGITAVQQTGTAIPGRFLLSQNFPNPFNPVTSINFDIPKSSFTKLIVFDQIGREVAVLVNEQLAPGSYKYDWNAVDYPSGIYFYKLQSGEFIETKKMILLK